MIKIHLIAAARPNFMKVAPLYHALRREVWCKPLVIHTGQHYDANMSDMFFRDLGLCQPHFHLGVGSGSHAQQTAGVLVAYEKLCLEHRPAMTVVVGDVNSTVACALAAKKLLIEVAHVEAGLRSRDRTMPEEINRIVTDSISDILFTPSQDADENLRNEGVSLDRIVQVGNIMIDSYELMRHQIEQTPTREKFGLAARSYGVVTLHRPGNVDSPTTAALLVSTLLEVADQLPLVFPVHPRTWSKLRQFDLLAKLEAAPCLHLAEPMSYIPFMGLVREARIVITDSGGLQEEATYLNIPCLTLRPNTERPITITHGTNRLVSPAELRSCVSEALATDCPNRVRPELWDGKTSERVVAELAARCIAAAHDRA